MATSTRTDPQAVEEPFPIFTLANRYLLYDVDVVTHVRRKHNISGVLIGGLAQAPQQNIFLGLPLELMPEEARLLVEKKVAYIVDDVAAHKRGFLAGGLSAEEKRAYQAALRKQGTTAANETSRKTHDRTRAAMAKKQQQQQQQIAKTEAEPENWNDIPSDMLEPRNAKKETKVNISQDETAGQLQDRDAASSDANEEDATLFAPTPTSSLRKRPDVTLSSRKESDSPSSSTPADQSAFAVTPTESYPPLQTTIASSTPQRRHELPPVPPSYPIFKHLHGQGYFLAPGLRFGCQYMAYPGDPLRFHSHFLVNGLDWDEEFSLLDLVGGGRLGTGVKKGFLLGGNSGGDDLAGLESDPETGTGGVRAFCVEWGGM